MRRHALLYLALTTLSFFTPSLATATNYQQCVTSSTCTIGEFLYNDDYTPLTGQTCTFTAKNPNGTAFVTSAAMTGRSDGWYSYDASIGTTTGLYSATICCNPTSGLMCLDKSFEVKTPASSAPSAAEIWSYSNRTLSSYGTLIADIWSYSSRTLSGFGNLVSDIWGYSNKTLTSFDFNVSSTPAPSTLQNIVAEQKVQRELLEKLVNAPIVTLELEDNNAPDLSQKIETSKAQASLLYDTVQSSKSRLLSLDEKWSRLSLDAITKEITSLSQIWNDSAPITALAQAWDTTSVDSLVLSANDTKNSLTSILSALTSSKSNTAPTSLIAALDSLASLENDLGDITSSSSDKTFYGYLASVSEKDELFKAESQKLSSLLDDWDGTGETVLNSKIQSSKSRLLAINEFSGGESVLAPSNKDAKGKAALKNLVFSMQGLVGLNRAKLASNIDAPVRGLWLEEGSIIFRAVITNPSSLISQDAPIRFYLPKELKMEDIMTIDPALTAAYDTATDALAVTGNFDLKPGTTQIVAVEVNDVWKLDDKELASIVQKATTLASALEKSNLLSQGLILKGDIESSIHKLIASQTKAVKPENRIKMYREAQLELVTVGQNMTQLENLVAQATSNRSLIGFVGGVSTTAVFGIILVTIAGFIFMTRYFERYTATTQVAASPDLTPAPSVLTSQSPSDSLSPSPFPRLTPLITPNSASPTNSFWGSPAFIVAIVVVTAGSTVALTRMASNQSPSSIAQITEASPTPLATSTPAPTVTPEPSMSPSPSSSSDLRAVRSETKDRSELSDPIFTHRIVVPEDSSVNIRNKPAPTADIIMSLKESRDIIIFKEDGDWTNIGFSEKDTTKGYWVSTKFIEAK